MWGYSRWLTVIQGAETGKPNLQNQSPCLYEQRWDSRQSLITVGQSQSSRKQTRERVTKCLPIEIHQILREFSMVTQQPGSWSEYSDKHHSTWSHIQLKLSPIRGAFFLGPYLSPFNFHLLQMASRRDAATLSEWREEEAQAVVQDTAKEDRKGGLEEILILSKGSSTSSC